MKRKGFTLVELLAVIAILAILVIIALPNVIKLFNDAKKNTFLTEVKSLYNQASSKYVSESMKGNKLSEINSSDSSRLDITGNLIYKIKLDNNGKVVSIAVKKGNYCISTTKDSSKVTKSDVKEDCDGFSVLANWYDECKDKNTLRCKMLSDNKTYDDSVKSEFVSSTSGINFKEISSDTNGKGLYYSTNQDVTDENNDGLTNRIYYYRGDIKNNFVVLGDKCYKILRTTENGNVKLMYHDNANTDGRCNELAKEKTTENTELVSEYNIHTIDNTYVGYMYGDEKLRPRASLNIGAIIESKEIRNNNNYYSSGYTFKDGKYYLTGTFEVGKFNSLCPDSSCKIKDYYTCISTSKDEGCSVLYKILTKSIVTKISTYKQNISSETTFAKSVKYNYEEFLSEGKYVLEGETLKGTVSEDSELCNATNCKIKDYYFLGNDSGKYFIYKVLGYSSGNYVYVEQLTHGTSTKKETLSNKNDSAIKKKIDTWYKKNIVDKNISSKITDEIYCNDRSLVTNIDNESAKSLAMKELSEMGDLNDMLEEYGYDDVNAFKKDFINYFKDSLLLQLGGVNYSSYYSQYLSFYKINGLNEIFDNFKDAVKQKAELSYKCINKEDRFTTSSLGNGKLKYPVATITLDETIYAGGYMEKENKNYFLAKNGSFWTMTPYMYNDDMGYGAYVGAVFKNGELSTSHVDTFIDGESLTNINWIGNIIPVISLKSDIEITKGNGTVSNPYVIK